jgi:hypothetical protein
MRESCEGGRLSFYGLAQRLSSDAPLDKAAEPWLRAASDELFVFEQ